jgi:transcriptional regulator GlxA family with amidase domain
MEALMNESDPLEKEQLLVELVERIFLRACEPGAAVREPLLRIERAKTLLQRGFDLSHVALECGFFDQSHLHRHFKAVTTVTPKEYQINFVQ